jgi:F-type H+-transporting ATPase subunit c
MRNLTIILIMLLSTTGPAIIVGLVGYAAVKAVGRNPAASARIMLAMILSFLFAESIAVLAILVVFNLFK